MTTQTTTAPNTAKAAKTPAATTAKPARKRRTHARRSAYGSVRQLPSGRWQARSLDGNGEYRSAPRTFDTKRDAEDWLATHRADLLRGEWISPDLGAIPLADYARDYLAGRVDLSPNTHAMYRRLLDSWILPEMAHPTGRRSVTLGTLHLRDLTPALLRDWHAGALAEAHRRAVKRAEAKDRRRRTRALHGAREWAIANGYPIKRTGKLPQAVLDAWAASGAPEASALALPATQPAATAGRVQVVQAYRFLRSVLFVAVQDGLIASNPCTIKGAGQIKSRERVPATPAEVAAIAARVPARYAAAVHLAAWSGLRAGELFGLTRAHVDLTNGAVRVERALIQVQGQPLTFGPPKTSSSLRTVHLPAPVVDVLREHLAAYAAPGPDALVFTRDNGQPVDSRTRTAMFRQACAGLGLTDFRWHDLRHTGATLATQSGASLKEVQARLGHSTFAAAMTYQHATAERDREVAGRLSALVVTGAPVDPTGQTAPVTNRPALRLVR